MLWETMQLEKVGSIVASKTETLAKWKGICKAMSTSEVEGSRQFQSSDDSKGDETGMV